MSSREWPRLRVASGTILKGKKLLCALLVDDSSIVRHSPSHPFDVFGAAPLSLGELERMQPFDVFGATL